MRRFPVSAVLVSMFFVLMLCGSRAYGQISSLKGISGVNVVVNLDDDGKALGLTEETVQTDAELKLRLAGLRILSDTERLAARGGPFLYVNIMVVRYFGRNAAAYQVEFCQNVTLERNGQFFAGATTWDELGLEVNPTAESIRSGIKHHVDSFLNAWLSVNPKK